MTYREAKEKLEQRGDLKRRTQERKRRRAEDLDIKKSNAEPAAKKQKVADASAEN